MNKRYAVIFAASVILVVLVTVGVLSSVVWLAEIEKPNETFPDYSGQFLVLADVHLDPLYLASEGPESFCRDPDKWKKASSECVDDPVSKKQKNQNYYYGQWKCDAPMTLLETT